MTRIVQPVWPVDPERWGQEGQDWAGQIEIPTPAALDGEYLVAVRLPDGQLVRYGVDGLWTFPREWQRVPTQVLDFQI
jgi:hypothetical protein